LSGEWPSRLPPSAALGTDPGAFEKKNRPAACRL